MTDLTPFLCVTDGPAAIDWYVEVLGAEVTLGPMLMPDGRLGHVELAVDGAGWMMSGEFPDHGVEGPGRRAGGPGGRAARSLRPPLVPERSAQLRVISAASRRSPYAPLVLMLTEKRRPPSLTVTDDGPASLWK